MIESDKAIWNALTKVQQTEQSDSGDGTKQLAEKDEEFLSRCFDVLRQGDLPERAQLSYTM